MEDTLQRIIYERLAGDNDLSEDAGLYVLSACEGPQYLEEVLEGTKVAPEPGEAQERPGPVGAYLSSLTVEGFRGIGPPTTLELTPGPGMTLIVGRNGSGKSSFAEALEVLLTGESRRWLGRPAVWREDWRNLHHQPARIAAGLLVEGDAGATHVSRSWEDGAPLEEATAEVQRPGRKKGPLESLGWDEALVNLRPILSYNELGSLLDEGPSKLYEAMFGILGLEDVVVAQKALETARKERERGLKDVTGRLGSIRARLEELEDERAQRALSATRGKIWDLDGLEALVVGEQKPEAEGELDLLRRVNSLEGPDPDAASEAAETIRSALAAVEEVRSTDAERARQVADLLDRALAFHSDHGDGDCPVCGRRAALEPQWRQSSEAEVERLRQEAGVADRARRRLAEAEGDARRLIFDPPPYLPLAEGVGVDPQAVRSAWQTWAEGADLQGEALAEHLERHAAPLADALAELRKRALEELAQREDVWRPLATELAAWLQDARAATARAVAVPALKKAEKWLKGAAAEIRDQRFEPIAAEAIGLWHLLRQQSNVELGRVELEGMGTRRRVVLDVTVDGRPGAALGVMSQGELHCLALSLFLPRARLPESPFRFIVIDDPVQSMDPARIDGLARVLEETARTRQVAVFTHDDRLFESVRRLGIDATVIEVTRRPDSIVELRPALDPVDRAIADARILVKTESLPENVTRRVVPGLCRTTVEAACAEVVRRRRLARGDPHREVEDVLVAATRFTTMAALALFDDPDRGGDVMSKLNQWGIWAGDTFKVLNKGTHAGFHGDFEKLVRDTKDLARRIRELG